MICFLALVMETALCRKLKEIGSTFSFAEILEDLTEIRAVEITVEGKRFLARTETIGNAYDAFKALKIRPRSYSKRLHNRPLWWYVCFSFHFSPCLAVFRFLAVKV